MASHYKGAVQSSKFAARTLETVSQWSRNERTDVLSMFLNVDNVGAKRMSSGSVEV